MSEHKEPPLKVGILEGKINQTNDEILNET